MLNACLHQDEIEQPSQYSQDGAQGIQMWIRSVFCRGGH